MTPLVDANTVDVTLATLGRRLGRRFHRFGQHHVPRSFAIPSKMDDAPCCSITHQFFDQLNAVYSTRNYRCIRPVQARCVETENVRDAAESVGVSDDLLLPQTTRPKILS